MSLFCESEKNQKEENTMTVAERTFNSFVMNKNVFNTKK